MLLKVAYSTIANPSKNHGIINASRIYVLDSRHLKVININEITLKMFFNFRDQWQICQMKILYKAGGGVGALHRGYSN